MNEAHMETVAAVEAVVVAASLVVRQSVAVDGAAEVAAFAVAAPRLLRYCWYCCYVPS